LGIHNYSKLCEIKLAELPIVAYTRYLKTRTPYLVLGTCEERETGRKHLYQSIYTEILTTCISEQKSGLTNGLSRILRHGFVKIGIRNGWVSKCVDIVRLCGAAACLSGVRVENAVAWWAFLALLTGCCICSSRSSGSGASSRALSRFPTRRGVALVATALSLLRGVLSNNLKISLASLPPAFTNC
jgi:hypothetical protein